MYSRRSQAAQVQRHNFHHCKAIVNKRRKVKPAKSEQNE